MPRAACHVPRATCPRTRTRTVTVHHRVNPPTTAAAAVGRWGGQINPGCTRVGVYGSATGRPPNACRGRSRSPLPCAPLRYCRSCRSRTVRSCGPPVQVQSLWSSWSNSVLVVHPPVVLVVKRRGGPSALRAGDRRRAPRHVCSAGINCNNKRHGRGPGSLRPAALAARPGRPTCPTNARRQIVFPQTRVTGNHTSRPNTDPVAAGQIKKRPLRCLSSLTAVGGRSEFIHNHRLSAPPPSDHAGYLSKW